MGGEFLLGDLRDFRRVGHFDWLALPGGDLATREPWRMALSCLHATYGRDYPRLPFLAEIPEHQQQLLITMIERGLNAPLTSSCGRLFDAVAALLGVRNHVSYEGQAALELEMLAAPGVALPYPFELLEQDGLRIFNSSAMIMTMVEELTAGVTANQISARFHATLVEVVATVCDLVRAETGIATIALSGGVFQNRLLTEAVIARLTAASFEVLTHSLAPPNDGGLSLGQAVVAGYRMSQ